MVNQLLLWAAENSRLEKFVADNPLASKTVQRFVAGAGLSDAVSAAVDLNTRGIDHQPLWLCIARLPRRGGRDAVSARCAA